MTQKIALFGTSADPPTVGHQTILCHLSQHFDGVVVWASNNPFKSHQTSLEHRSEMLRLLIEEINSPQQNIWLHPEMSSPWTLETVERAQQQWPGATLILVVGSDLVPQLPRWYKAEQLLPQVGLLIVPRPGYDAGEIDVKPLEKLGAEVTIATWIGPNVSSTAYREEGDTTNLTPPIAAYIHREQLYQWQDVTQKRMQITH